MEWYYLVNGEKIGPVEETVIVEMIKSGKLDRKTLVWKQGMSGWTKAEDCLLQYFKAPPSLPVPKVYASLLVWLPLLTFIFSFILIIIFFGNMEYNKATIVNAILFLALLSILSVFLISADIKAIKMSMGSIFVVNPKLGLWGMFYNPFYLLKRSHFVGGSRIGVFISAVTSRV
jgi:hypothetical protein